MINFGSIKPGSTLYIPFDTFGSDGQSITMSGFAVTDIEVYKNGSTTQRASDNGYTLLDTDGTDFDGITGIQGFSINLADNSDAGFYAAGSDYFVVVSSITVDSQTVNFVAARFRIGYPGAMLDTTIATLSNQTSFTLAAGPAENDALNGMLVAIHDVASAVQCGYAVVQDYVGSTKTVTLAAGTTFTVAVGDNISVVGPVPLQATTEKLSAAGRTLSVDSSGNGMAQLANSVAHGGSAATLRLGASGSTPPLWVENTGTGSAMYLKAEQNAPALHIRSDDVVGWGWLGGAACLIEAVGTGGAAIYLKGNGDGVGMFVSSGGLAIDLDGYSINGTLEGNVNGKVLGGGAATLLGTGVQADVRAWNGTAPNNLQSGRVDAYVGAMAASSIVAASIATDARDALAAAFLDLANGVETGYTLRQALRLIAAACVGKRSNTGTVNEQFDAIGSPGTARVVGNLNVAGDGTPTLLP